MERLTRRELGRLSELAGTWLARRHHARGVVAGWYRTGRGHLLTSGERGGLRRPGMMRPRSLPHRAEELARWRLISGRSPGRGASGRRESLPRRDAGARTREAARPLSGGEAVSVRQGAVSGPLVAGEPGTWARLAGTRGAVVLFERVLAEPLPGWRATGVAALRRCLILRAPRLRGGVPRPGLRTAGKRRLAGGAACGHAGGRAPIAGPGKTRRAVSWSARIGGTPWWEQRLTPIFSRAGAVARPGCGTGLRLPAPPL